MHATPMSAILEPLESPPSGAASVPRRFGAGVLLVLVTAFAVLFAVMRSAHLGPKSFSIFAVFFLGITLGQILLFQGKRPRRASLLVGAVLLPLEWLVADRYVVLGVVWSAGDVLRLLGVPRNLVPLLSVATAVLLALLGVIASALIGYLVGCVMAGIFFVAESIRRRSHPPLKIEIRPFTAADFDALIAWVRHAELFDLWSRGRFRYPLDHEQLAARLGLAAGEPPALICFKAVLGEMQQMAAYAELANIDREKLCASVELAIVDPSQSERNRLSDVLVREIVRIAFQEQGLQWLSVELGRNETQSLECFRKHGFFAAPGEKPQECRRLIRSKWG